MGCRCSVLQHPYVQHITVTDARPLPHSPSPAHIAVLKLAERIASLTPPSIGTTSNRSFSTGQGLSIMQGAWGVSALTRIIHFPDWRYRPVWRHSYHRVDRSGLFTIFDNGTGLIVVLWWRGFCSAINEALRKFSMPSDRSKHWS